MADLAIPAALPEAHQWRQAVKQMPCAALEQPAVSIWLAPLDLDTSNADSGGLLSPTRHSEPTPLDQLPILANDSFNSLWPRDSKGQKAVFLDYDGTLREFEARPELAVPTDDIHTLLEALNAREDIVVYMISGRDASFLQGNFSRHRRLNLVAEHERRLRGRFQIWRSEDEDSRPSPPGTPERIPGDEDWKPFVTSLINDAIARVPDSHVEEKASSLVWHYRSAADQESALAVARALEEDVRKMLNVGCFSQAVNVSRGHKIVEVAHRCSAKGSVLRQICAERIAGGLAPFEAIFIAGDDVSDESMFESAPVDSLTVKVGHASTTPTRARFRVDSPAELRRLLWHVVQ